MRADGLSFIFHGRLLATKAAPRGIPGYKIFAIVVVFAGRHENVQSAAGDVLHPLPWDRIWLPGEARLWTGGGLKHLFANALSREGIIPFHQHNHSQGNAFPIWRSACQMPCHHSGG